MAVTLGLAARGQSGKRKHLPTLCVGAAILPRATLTVNIVPCGVVIDRRRTKR
jgi:hypothetical protein